MTVTDANAVLGYYPEAGLLAGSVPLDIDAARRGLHDQISCAIGVRDEEAAYGIHEIANAEMTRALIAVTYQVGRDARDFTLVAYGGAGPVHAVALASELGVRHVLVPPRAGVFSSVGMLVGRLEYEHVQSVLRTLDTIDGEELAALLRQTSREVTRLSSEDGYAAADVTIVHVGECRYVGENATLDIPIEDVGLPGEMAERFAELHEKRFGFRTKERIQLVSVRTSIHVTMTEHRSMPMRAPSDGQRTSARSRRAYFGPRFGWCDAAVLQRTDLVDASGRGPMIIEDYDTTTVIRPDATARMDQRGNIEITVETVP